MEDRLLILQIAFSMVADSPFYESLPLDSRIEEVKNVYNKLTVLIGDGVDRYAAVGDAVERIGYELSWGTGWYVYIG